ncbi:MAG: glycosyltransferase family 39 protein, partial [Anaerolineae bacterium]
LPTRLSGPQSPPVRAGAAAIGLVVALCTAAAYALLFRVWGWTAAVVAGFFLALDPFHVTHSKMIHVDALLASFMLLSVLFLISYLQEDKWEYLAASGVFGGLSLLTKSPALFLIPFSGLVVTLHTASARSVVSAATPRLWRGRLREIVGSLTVWSVTVACLFFVLWPAMWVQPLGTISSMLKRGVLRHAQSPHPFRQFFLGQLVNDPGPLYYPASLAWKTTLVTLPAVGLAIWFLVRGGRSRDCETPWYVLLYAGAFLLQMTLGAKKSSRYVLPAFLALDVLAAWGVAQTAAALKTVKLLRGRGKVPIVALVVALSIHFVGVVRHHPYYGTHHNLLLGGSRVARHVFQLGDQGEGLDLAAEYLNSQPGAGLLTAGVCDHGNLMFRENFEGVTKPINHPGVDYRVFFINDLQRAVRFAHCEDRWRACEQKGPVWTASFDGVPYVGICRAYPQDVDGFATDRHLNIRVGDHIELRGYSVSPKEVSAGSALTVTLYWRSDGEVTADNHVFVHLSGENGRLVAQDDGVPANGRRATWSWQPMEVVPDDHVLKPLEIAPSGTYTLSVGMYDYGTMTRLTAITSDGVRLPADRITLQDFKIGSP